MFAQVRGCFLLPTPWWEQVGALTAELRIVADQKVHGAAPYPVVSFWWERMADGVIHRKGEWRADGKWSRRSSRRVEYGERGSS